MRASLLAPSALVLTQVLSGCATQAGSTAAGASLGGAIGGGAAAAASRWEDGRGRARNIIIGTAIGASVGALSGHAAHAARAPRSENDQAATETPADDGKKAPRLLPAKTEAIFVDDQVKGQTFIPAHFEYKIIEPARWEK